METFTEDTFESRKARIVSGDEGVGVMVGLRWLFFIFPIFPFILLYIT